MAEGSDGAREIFQPSKRTKSEVCSCFGFYKSPEGNLIADGHPVCRSCKNKVAAKGGNTSKAIFSGRAAGKPSGASGPSTPSSSTVVKADVVKNLAQGTWFAATTDLWTSESGGGQPYISFTIHYLTPDWQLESNCLETQFFPEDHLAHNISEFFENMLEEWGINKKELVCITTDNATNMIKAFEGFSDVWLGQGLPSPGPGLLTELEEKARKITTLEDRVKEEIQVYLSLPPRPAKEDPLVWWRGHASELPHLARVARKRLCIPATSVPSERVLSASGHT
ncbi:E3 SUMO-protein ligase ZBED1 [Labeo rohita]|uniref:E3 SUMO-protein ligase ZBED1 n=1 Tax=Labeo rohita TaxID=84645 RepID=A0ABQ8L5Y8_LABRO|nr:E3 SUMO-protein ligase ZBED1 [Labeo rohita]